MEAEFWQVREDWGPVWSSCNWERPLAGGDHKGMVWIWSGGRARHRMKRFMLR